MPPFDYQLTMLVTLKAGAARGRSSLRIGLESPDGLVEPGPAIPVVFESEDRGVNLIAPSRFTFEKEGVYWFTVTCGGTLLTRIPLRVIYSPMPPQSASV